MSAGPFPIPPWLLAHTKRTPVLGATGLRGDLQDVVAVNLADSSGEALVEPLGEGVVGALGFFDVEQVSEALGIADPPVDGDDLDQLVVQVAEHAVGPRGVRQAVDGKGGLEPRATLVGGEEVGGDPHVGVSMCVCSISIS